MTINSLNDSYKIQQINDVFDYFLNKLCSEKQAVRIGSFKILQKLLIPDKQNQIDLNYLIDAIKQLTAFNIYLQPLLIKYFRRALMVETNPLYLNVYICFLFEQLISDYQQKFDLELSLQMQIDQVDESTPLLIKNESFKNTINEIAIGLSSFFFDRPNCFESVICFTQTSPKIYKQMLANYFSKFIQILLSLNEYNINENDDKNLNIKSLIKINQPFDRNSIEKNSYLLLELNSNFYIYIHEKVYNLIVYLITFVIDATDFVSDQNDEINNLFKNQFVAKCETVKLLNCSIKEALNDHVKNKLLSMNCVNRKLTLLIDNKEQSNMIKFTMNITEALINSISDSSKSIETKLFELFECLTKRYGISLLSIYLILNKIELIFKENVSVINDILNKLCDLIGCNLNHIIDLVDLNRNKLLKELDSQTNIGHYLLTEFNLIKEKFTISSESQQIKESIDDLFLFKKSTKPMPETVVDEINTELNQKNYSINYLNRIQSQIEDLKLKKQLIIENKSEPMQIEQGTNDSIDDIIKTSTKQTLETNLNAYLNKIDSTNERISLISNSIINLEKNESNEDMTTVQADDLEQNFARKTRCIVDILLDYFCHLDPQIISDQNEIEYQVLFESRQMSLSKLTTQPFLLSLFIHQGDWKKLYNCVQFLLNSENTNNLNYK